MMENKDPAIKLFGRKIPVTTDGESTVVSGGASEDDGCDRESTSKVANNKSEAEKELEKLSPAVTRDAQSLNSDSPPMDPETSPEACTHEQIKNAGTKGASVDDEKLETTEKTNELKEQAVLKKPDKIVPCPRCKSMETKFCYYNNYNINQPRHFCRSCQRYWTNGGTMRNVPVGAGRRKSKNAAAIASNYRSMVVSEALQHHPKKESTAGGATVLSFGSDVSMSESALTQTGVRPSTGCSTTADSSSMDETWASCGKQPASAQSPLGLDPKAPCLLGFPSSYPGLCHPAFPVFYPAASYWNCAIPCAWPVPWLPGSNPSAPAVGKHSRDGNDVEETRNSAERGGEQEGKDSETSVWVPKTLRIDDPNEAAKSSIWATLGIKNELASGGGIFKRFQHKAMVGKKEGKANEPSPLLCANPAALSRSINFHENS